MPRPPVQRFPVRSRPSAAAVFAMCLTWAACGPTLPPLAAPAPAEIPHLETMASQQPAPVTALVRLGAAYRAAGRLEEARETLQRAALLSPRDGGVALYLGLTHEDLGELGEARRLYEDYIRHGSSAQVRNALRRRMPALERRELQAAIRLALAREGALETTPDPATVAVFPFAMGVTDESLQPLGRAFAELLVTDLAITGRLRVLERAHVQLLLDEQQLGQSVYADPAAATRSGRLLGAGRIVQGQVHGDPARLRLLTAVVNSGTGQFGELRPVSTEGGLAELFDIQKRIAFMVYDELQIELTAAERERLGVHRTRNVEALLAFGLGLEASDLGRFAEAAAHFQRASAIDPDFTMAAAHAERASNMAGETSSTNDLAIIGARHAQLGGPADTDAFTAIQQALVPAGPDRDAAAEALGQEGFSRPSILQLIIRRPQ
jgi:tetratricopeptide (TPR) repeat protein